MYIKLTFTFTPWEQPSGRGIHASLIKKPELIAIRPHGAATDTSYCRQFRSPLTNQIVGSEYFVYCGELFGEQSEEALQLFAKHYNYDCTYKDVPLPSVHITGRHPSDNEIISNLMKAIYKIAHPNDGAMVKLTNNSYTPHAAENYIQGAYS